MVLKRKQNKIIPFQSLEQLFLREKRDGAEMREHRVNVFVEEAENNHGCVQVAIVCGS